MNIFIPHNIESRKEKLRQANLKLLQLEHISDNLIIDDSFIWDFDPDLVKTKTIKSLFINGSNCPKWVRNVEILDTLQLNNPIIQNIPYKTKYLFIVDLWKNYEYEILRNHYSKFCQFKNFTLY